MERKTRGWKSYRGGADGHHCFSRLEVRLESGISYEKETHPPSKIFFFCFRKEKERSNDCPHPPKSGGGGGRCGEKSMMLFLLLPSPPPSSSIPSLLGPPVATRAQPRPGRAKKKGAAARIELSSLVRSPPPPGERYIEHSRTRGPFSLNETLGAARPPKKPPPPTGLVTCAFSVFFVPIVRWARRGGRKTRRTGRRRIKKGGREKRGFFFTYPTQPPNQQRWGLWEKNLGEKNSGPRIKLVKDGGIKGSPKVSTKQKAQPRYNFPGSSASCSGPAQRAPGCESRPDAAETKTPPHPTQIRSPSQLQHKPPRRPPLRTRGGSNGQRCRPPPGPPGVLHSFLAPFFEILSVVFGSFVLYPKMARPGDDARV